MTNRRLRFTGRAVATSVAAVLLLPVAPAGAGTVPAASATEAAPGTGQPSTCPSRTPAEPGRAPVLAHFYIWFTATSWQRAKTDFPAVGRYSSDQADVMRTQVAQAHAAGLDGFIVSWKSTPQLNSRLAALRQVAADNGFKLALTYEAQDFQRNPLPVAQVQKDLQWLADTYAADPVFHVLGSRPVVALSGTWNYSLQDLRSITAPVASRLMVLATEKSTSGYDRVASAVDGELYYWSSADPESTGRYQEKLFAMANAARRHCGVWVAPVAPGFDARKVGGQTVVPRRNGATLRSSWQAALCTVPDAVGVISWNEYSESTYIEPSDAYGNRYLDVLHDLTTSPSPPPKEMDSSGPAGSGSPLRLALTLATSIASVLAVGAVGLRRRHRLHRTHHAGA